MKSTLTQSPVPRYIGVDLTDRYALRCRPIDVCGLDPTATGELQASFWQWLWDPAPTPLDVSAAVRELRFACCSMIDGAQGLARRGRPMRNCDRLAAAAAKVPDKRPSGAVPFGGFVCSSLDLFAGLSSAGLAVSPSPPRSGVGEVYPGAIWPILGGTELPKKTTRSGIEARFRILTALGVAGLPDSVTHDHLDAAIGAVVAAAAAGAVDGLSVKLIGDRLYRERGILREGPMVFPVLEGETLTRRRTRATTGSPSPRPHKRPLPLALPARSGEPAGRAQDLLRWLADRAAEGNPHVCTYRWVYYHLLGRRPARWSRAYAIQVLRVSAATTPVPLEGLGPVRLDTFIVVRSSGEPGRGHWSQVPYTLERWREVLAGANPLSLGRLHPERRVEKPA